MTAWGTAHMKMCLAALKPASLTFNHISNSCYNLNDMSVHLYYSTFTLLFFFLRKKKKPFIFSFHICFCCNLFRSVNKLNVSLFCVWFLNVADADCGVERWVQIIFVGFAVCKTWLVLEWFRIMHINILTFYSSSTQGLEFELGSR